MFIFSCNHCRPPFTVKLINECAEEKYSDKNNSNNNNKNSNNDSNNISNNNNNISCLGETTGKDKESDAVLESRWSTAFFN